MHLRKLSIRNFRRLKDVVIDLAEDISIFVGANNSGKTSVGHALQLFTGRSKFSLHDFSVEMWKDFSAFAEERAGVELPSMSIDIWLEVRAPDLHRVIDLLPSLEWQGSLVGMRIAYVPIDSEATRARYRDARRAALAAAEQHHPDGDGFDPEPRNLQEYLQRNLHGEYEFRYYVLDPARFDADMRQEAGYEPAEFVAGRDRSGREVINSLVQIDFLHAQRHLSDGPGGSRAEDLSRVLSRFYARNLEKRGDDIDVLRALSESEASLNEHLQRVFEPTLRSLSELGYPGVANPRLVIKTELDPAVIMTSRDGAKVHYAVGISEDGVEPPTLPDRYNGLGFKNLIFMVVELLDLHAQWLSVGVDRPPLHLVFVEEPEAHLHAQLQQTFIRKVLELLKLPDDELESCCSQVVVTTHSAHILYEKGFQPIRYFRRSQADNSPISEVLNLSVFYRNTEDGVRNFLERYLRLTHCDLFFADAVVLVEGNVERLLLPQMIADVAPRLQSTCLSILEVGGAFGYRFKSLIDFLGITALVITDLDSTVPRPSIGAPAEGVAATSEEAQEDDDEDDGEGATRAGRACQTSFPGAVTSNQTLIQWLPGKAVVSELLAASEGEKVQVRIDGQQALVRVTYQQEVSVTWGGATSQIAGRTLEEAFALENLNWTQGRDRSSLQLRIPRSDEKDLEELARRIHLRVKSTNFNKTDFALALLSEDPANWVVPSYIADGLRWLEQVIAPIADEQVFQGENSPAAQERGPE